METKLSGALIKLLTERGIKGIKVSKYYYVKYLRKSRNPYQRIAIDLLLGKYSLCLGDYSGRVVYDDEVKIICGAGDVDAQAYLSKEECVEVIDIREELKRYIPQYPIFIIDVLKWFEHTEGEKNEMIEQILTSLALIRNYLWDGNLAITSVNDEFLRYLSKYARGMRHSMILSTKTTPEFIKSLGVHPDEVIFLDPEGNYVLSLNDLRKAKVFVIGGIVDKERIDVHGSYKLYVMSGLNELGVRRFRIELKGSVRGVPDRINKIIEILLCSIFRNEDIDRCIINSMTKADKVLRVMAELVRNAKRIRIGGKTKLVIELSKAKEFLRWLNVDEDIIELAAKKANVRLV